MSANKVEDTEQVHGFAWIFAFDEQCNARTIRPDASFSLEREKGFVWAHLGLADTRARKWIAAQDLIFEDAREAVLSSESHPQLEWRRDALWGTLYDIQREFNGFGDDSTDVRFILTPRFLLTARRHPIHSADVVRRRIEAGAEIDSSAALFEQLVDCIIDDVGAALHRIAGRLDRVEDRVLSETLSDERAPLLELRRIISRYNRLIGGLHNVFSRLDRPRSESAAEIYREIGMRVVQRITSLHDDVHLLAERSRMLQDEVDAQLTSETNRNLFVLTILTTLLLPATLVTGFFGMNTKGMFFAESDNATLFAAFFCCLASAIVYWIIRRNNILG